MRAKVFCPECRQDVSFSVREKLDCAELKNETFEFIAKVAYCDACGNEVYVHEIEDENLKTLYDLYREKHDIISLEDIREIPDKYNIGKRPLSLLLGWGENTFSRYYDGDIPSKQYSEILKRICADPSYYFSLLESGKENLKSELAFSKSKEATQKLLSIEPIASSKLDLVAKYLISQCRDITPLSLQKALYYAQGFSKAFLGKFLFADDCEAWVHGPVYHEIYDKYRCYSYDQIDEPVEPDISSLPAEEKILLDSIAKYLCCYSGKILEAFTHIEAPWVLTRGDLPAGAPTNKIIPKKVIGDYFSTVKEKYKMINPANIKDYAQDMFSKV